MPQTPRPLPAHLGPQFAAGQAVAAGIPRSRLRAKDLVSPYHGVRRRVSFIREQEKRAREDTEPYAEDRRRRARVLADARAYSEVQPEGSFVCGRSAAVLHGLPIDHPGDLEVASIAPRRAPRGRGVKGRKAAERLVELCEVDGVTVTNPASTWAMLGRELTVRELVRLGDAIVRIPRDSYGQQHPEQALATLDDLRAAAYAGPRPPGTARLREALELVRVGSSSPLETDFRLDAAAGGLPEPELDVEIRDERGRLLGISEFVHRRYRTVVEIEGDHHRTSRAQWNRDIEKYRAYAQAGWHVERLTSTHINGHTAVRIVGEALIRHGWVP